MIVARQSDEQAAAEFFRNFSGGGDEAPRVSIIVPCRNEASHIAASLQSILTQQTPAGGSEILVADGRSDDETRSIISQITNSDSRVRLIDNPGRIASTGLNAALAAARGEIIIRMDAHTEYADDYVVQCVSVLERTTADCVGGPWVAVGDRLLGRAIAAAFQSPFGSGGGYSRRVDYDGPVDTVYLGCWRRETLKHLGGFDDELVRNQDDEFSFRVILSGGTIWQSPSICSRYHTRGSWRKLFWQQFQYGYWKVRVMQKHGRPVSCRHLVPCLFVLFIVLGGGAGLHSHDIDDLLFPRYRGVPAGESSIFVSDGGSLWVGLDCHFAWSICHLPLGLRDRYAGRFLGFRCRSSARSHFHTAVTR